MIIKICTGSSCHLNGSYDVIQEFKSLLKKYDVEDLIELKASFCFNECINGVDWIHDEPGNAEYDAV